MLTNKTGYDPSYKMQLWWEGPYISRSQFGFYQRLDMGQICLPSTFYHDRKNILALWGGKSKSFKILLQVKLVMDDKNCSLLIGCWTVALKIIMRNMRLILFPSSHFGHYSKRDEKNKISGRVVKFSDSKFLSLWISNYQF